MCTSKDSQYPESLRKFKLELQWNVILCTKAVKTKLSRQQFIGRERGRETGSLRYCWQAGKVVFAVRKTDSQHSSTGRSMVGECSQTPTSIPGAFDS